MVNIQELQITVHLSIISGQAMQRQRKSFSICRIQAIIIWYSGQSTTQWITVRVTSKQERCQMISELILLSIIQIMWQQRTQNLRQRISTILTSDVHMVRALWRTCTQYLFLDHRIHLVDLRLTSRRKHVSTYLTMYQQEEIYSSSMIQCHHMQMQVQLTLQSHFYQ